MRWCLLALVLACGSNEADAPKREAPPVETPTPTPTPTTTPAPTPCEPGWSTAFTPTADQLASNRRALARLADDDVEGARIELTTLVDAAPDYDSARFNLACTLARLDRDEEARALLETLLCRDLPTNLPRARADEDLRDLRGDVDTIASRVLPRYRETEGVALVAFGKTEVGGDFHAPHLHWNQSGLWTGERFVPAGPRQQARHREHPPLLASAIAGDVVVLAESVSSSAEMDFLPPVAVTAVKIFEGDEIAQRRFDVSQEEYYGIAIGAVDGRAWIGFEGFGDDAPAPRVQWIDDGSRIATLPEGSLDMGMQTWAPSAATSSHRASRRGLRVGETTIALDARHRRMNGPPHVLGSGPLALAVSEAVGDCGVRDRWVIEMVDTAAGSSLWNAHGEGQVLLRFYDGKLWMQLNDALFVLPDPRRDERTPLPAGLGLSSTWYSFNPMC